LVLPACRQAGWIIFVDFLPALAVAADFGLEEIR
jgi:hypothetical protein